MTDSTIDQFFTPVSSRSKRSRPNSTPENDPIRTMSPGGEKVGDLTPQQLKDIMSTLLDDKLAHLATKEDLASVSGQVAALTRENQELKEQVGQLKKQEKVVLNKLLDLESRSRRNNIIIRGLTWKGTSPNYRQIVQKFCEEQLGSGKNLWVNRAHPLGQDGKTLIAHIPDDADLEYILNQARSNLKGTGYVIHRDFPLEVRRRRACLVAVRAEVERLTGRRRMPLAHDHLIIDGCRLTWEDGRLMAGRQDGVERLKELIKQDLTAFVAGLEHGPPERPAYSDKVKNGVAVGEGAAANNSVVV